MKIILVLSLLVCPVFATDIALVQHSVDPNTCAFTTGAMTCALPSVVTSDATHQHVVVIGIAVRTNLATDVSSVSVDNSACGGVAPVSLSKEVGSGTYAAIYGCIVANTTGSAPTVTVSMNNSYFYGHLMVAEYSDAVLTPDGASGNTGLSGTSDSCGTITPALPNVMLIGVNYYNSGSTLTEPSGWTKEVKRTDATNGRSSMFAQKFLATSSAQSPVFAAGASAAWSCAIVALPSLIPPPNKRAQSEFSYAGIPYPDFSIAWFPDAHERSSGEPWTTRAQYAIDRVTEWNTKAIVFTGDIQAGGDTISGFATHGWNALLALNLPIAAALGNHDCNIDACTAGALATSQFDQYVGYQTVSSKSWGPALAFSGVGDDVGLYDDTAGFNSQANYAVRFSVGTHKFLIIALETFARDVVMTWGKNLAAVYPDHQVIWITHGYLIPDSVSTNPGRPCRSFDAFCGGTDGGSQAGYSSYQNSGQQMYDKLFKVGANTFMTLSAHYPTAYPTTQRAASSHYFTTGTNTNSIFGFESDFQAINSGGFDENDAVIRIVFHEQTHTFDVLILSALGLSTGADPNVYTTFLGNAWPQL